MTALVSGPRSEGYIVVASSATNSSSRGHSFQQELPLQALAGTRFAMLAPSAAAVAARSPNMLESNGAAASYCARPAAPP